jgi:EpsI family protein
MIFLILAVLISVLANSLRAFGIILIAHYSNLRYAVGVDHIIYGWLFFGVIISIVFYVGNKMKDDDMINPSSNNESSVTSIANDDRQPSLLVVKLLIILFVLSTLFMQRQLSVARSPSSLKINKAVLSKDFVELPRGLSVHPVFISPNDTYVGRSTNNINVDLYIARYADYFKGREMISEANDIYQIKNWSLIDEKTRSIVIKNKAFSYNIIRLASKDDSSKTILYWYQLPGEMESNKAKVKIWQGIHKLLGDYDQGAFIALTVREMQPTNKEMDNIVKSSYGIIQKALGY